MFPDEKKLTRLTTVLKMYYEEEMSQMEIAKEIGVSRPMVSKMLAEAKSLNMVTITINEVKNMQQMLSRRIEEKFNIHQVIVIKTDKMESAAIQEKIALECFYVCQRGQISYHRVGIGCGSMIGQLSEVAKARETNVKGYKGEIFPLIGGFKASYRSYHTNELVRIFSEYTKLTAFYMHLPALVDSEEEKELYKKTELYSDIESKWENMNVALINISNLYSTPDLATSIRFGNRLKQSHAVGRYLAYYYDIDGNFIQPERDNVMQTEIENIKKAKYVIGMCSDKTDAHSALGALRTGVFTHMVMTDIVAQNMLNLIED